MKHIERCMDLALMLDQCENGEITNVQFCTALDKMCTAIGTEFLATEILTRMPEGTTARLDRIFAKEEIE